ncbi:MAG: sigma-54 dependent transcriptional regulator [Thermoanaerobaculia bacterium]|nr:sigma-54 dependent transcriptional regulator [Thermoanaerobaculia bacterium]
MKSRVLIVDDEPRMAEAIATAMRRSGYACRVATRGDEALDLFREHGADLVVTDLRVPGVDGMELLARLQEERPDVPVIVITAYGDVRTAVEAMRDGAFDYVTKPFDNDELRTIVGRALELRRLRIENRGLRYAVDAGLDLIAESESMRTVLELVDRAAPSTATVLLTGETGTGKERIARRLHLSSGRAEQPFVAVNCRAFAPGVLEGELFGHEKGAFTGADVRRAGCFQRAEGGTIFLDEIGDVESEFQAKLLRVLQEGEVQPVGGDRALSVDVRVVAATHRDLRREVAKGRFREDLYFRLAVIPVHLPSLRERAADVLPLARHFLGSSGKTLTPDAEQLLVQHVWPGNVRELENAIERATVLCRGVVIGAEDLWLEETTLLETEGQIAVDSPSGTLREALDASATERIRAALEAHEGRRNEAAAELGVDRTTLFRMVKRLGL